MHSVHAKKRYSDEPIAKFDSDYCFGQQHESYNVKTYDKKTLKVGISFKSAFKLPLDDSVYRKPWTMNM